MLRCARGGWAWPRLVLTMALAAASLPAVTSAGGATGQVEMQHLERLPLLFVPEPVSSDGAMAYAVRGREASVWVADRGLSFRLHSTSGLETRASSWVVALDLVGATPRQPVGEDRLPTRVSYFSLQLRNCDVEPPVDPPTMTAHITLEADSMEQAEDRSRIHLRLFLDRLALITSHKFAIIRIQRVVDWEAGQEMRKLVQIDEFPDPNIPRPFLDPRHLASVGTIQKTNDADRLTEVYRWFALGVGAQHLDDQFQYFWSALEVLCQIRKSSGRVPDLCPVCREALYCPKCMKTPTHRPYRAQEIEDLIRSHVEGEEQDTLVEMALKARNVLFHGGSMAKVEEEFQHTFDELVDFVGKAAVTAVISAIREAVAEAGTADSFLQIATDSYTHGYLSLRNNFDIGTRDPENPTIEELPAITITMHSQAIDPTVIKGNENGHDSN